MPGTVYAAHLRLAERCGCPSRGTPKLHQRTAISAHRPLFSTCISPACGATYAVDEVRVACGRCGSLLDVAYDWQRLPPPKSLRPSRRNGAPRPIPIASAACGDSTSCSPSCRWSSASPSAKGKRCCTHRTAWPTTSACSPAGCILQYEGLNPSGSFKDNGMSAAFSHARLVGASRAACASTGNTSASLALYCVGHPADEGGDLRRLREDRLRQALPGPGLRRPDGADRRRFRRRHGPRAGSQPSNWESTWSTASIPSAWKGRRRSCTGCWRASAGKCPTGSSSPAATWATPAPSARPSTSCTSWA